MFVKTALDEPESAAVQHELAHHDLTSSRLLVTESRRAIMRAGRGDRLDRLLVRLEAVDLVEIDADVIETAARLGPPTLGTLDAIHLATASRVPGIDVFVCLDARLSEAAEAFGLKVASPR